MELNELHIDQLGPRVISERVPVAGVLPTIARNSVRAADSAGGQHNRFRFEQTEAPSLPIVAERPDHSITVF